jgi:putative nucleotidyltransferase with HDIG domain
MTTPLRIFSQDWFDKILLLIPADKEVYLVGGAVRDFMLGKPVNDYDFAVSQDALGLGRKVANALEGAYYPLDAERDTARVILYMPDGTRQILDFAGMRGVDIETDLRARDFTLNAMAIPLDGPRRLLDPLHGAEDLKEKVLRACSEDALAEDPLRILRAVRLGAKLSLRIMPETIDLMRQAKDLLPRVSAERIRDELIRILETPKVASSIRILDMLEVLPYILPELSNLKGIKQTLPHTQDVWEHTLQVLHRLEDVLEVLAQEHDPEKSGNWAFGFMSLRLGRYRMQIREHLHEKISGDRTLRGLLFLGALYHDIGKPEAYQEVNERIRFLRHEQIGAQMAGRRARELRLSNEEIRYVKLIVRHHMRPLSLTQTERKPTRRAIYRFFRDCGESGIDICLLSLADTLAAYGPRLPEKVWEDQLTVVRSLMEAWWERQEQEVNPPVLVKGGELIEYFGITPGPQVGELMKVIQEAQATGEVVDREGVLDLARLWLEAQGAAER